MAEAYAALVSLMNVLNRVQHPTCPATFHKLQLQSLFSSATFLVNFFESYSHSISKELERKITGAAYRVQDKIESYLVVKIHARRARKVADRIHARFAMLRYTFLQKDLERAIKGMDLIITEAMEVQQKRGEKNQPPRSTLNVGSSAVMPSETIKIVGFDEELNRLLEQLVTYQSSREIISVVGMAGIGKSTLARSVYTHPYVRDQFHVKAWVTISQVYDAKTIIRPLLHDLGVRVIDDDAHLGDQLYKYLFGRKYLIVVDDIWDSQAWDEIRRFLPDNNNGSRVLLTTRLLNVALTVGSCVPYEMHLLNDERSWDLLSKKVFGQQVYPAELEIYGKEIAKSCKGLPLAIVVIGGMLKMHDCTTEYWENVARNISSIISREDNENCLKILCLSYHELPIHLRPCFLYMSIFPEDHDIRVSEVTMLWAADGFLKPNGDDTLEEVALENLKDLISRNLIMVKKRDSRGRMKHLIVHDSVRDMCIREAQKEGFLYVDGGERAIECQRRFALHGSGHVSFPTARQERLVRSFISFGKRTSRLDMPFVSLLQVFLVFYKGTTPKDIAQLPNLRFIRLFGYRSYWQFNAVALFTSISFLWNLETLIVDVPDRIRLSESYSLPVEIWELPHIKHLVFSEAVILPDPHTDSVLNNLQTLTNVRILSKEVLHRIPNIKDLGIQPPCFWNLVHCLTLEVLYLDRGVNFYSDVLNTINLFPIHLKKLTLSRCDIPWDRMTLVGSLPNLEVLKLRRGSFIGEEWNSTEGEFKSLKVLSIVDCNFLETWMVEDWSHFPCLEHLSLRSLENLEEVPQVFGESMTLKSIRMERCKSSVVISAKQILDEQESLGNYDLTVEALYPLVVSKEQHTELESLASDRFHVQLRQW